MRGDESGIELGEALLGQRLVAGIGNIFKSEGCFAARVDPQPSARRRSATRSSPSVLEATRELMLEAVESGRQPKRVYRRAGSPVRAAARPIRSRAQGDSARTTYWCPAARRAEPAIIGAGMESGARQQIVELLGGVPLFSELSPDELDRVAQVAIPRSFPRDTRVFHEGDPGDACYIVQPAAAAGSPASTPTAG